MKNTETTIGKGLGLGEAGWFEYGADMCPLGGIPQNPNPLLVIIGAHRSYTFSSLKGFLRGVLREIL